MKQLKTELLCAFYAGFGPRTIKNHFDGHLVFIILAAPLFPFICAWHCAKIA